LQRVREKNIRAIEFRGCNLGRNAVAVATFKNCLGAASFGAPKLHSFFGRNPTSTGANIMRTHSRSHTGTTITYTQTFADKTCHCCIGVNAARKPQNGHVVADDDATINRWIQANFQNNITRGRDRQLPIHGLWEFPTVDLNNPDPLAGLDDTPRPIFPLAVDDRGRNEYARNIVYSP